MRPSVLLIEDEPLLAKNLRIFLERCGYEVRVHADGANGLRAFADARPDIVVLDYNLPGTIDGLRVLTRMREADPDAVVVMITGHGSERIAVDAMKGGAWDYLSKPVTLDSLRGVLEGGLEERRRRLEPPPGPDPSAGRGGPRAPAPRLPAVGSLESMIGRSRAMQGLRAAIRRIVEAETQLVDADPPAVLITGETGTGKELAARALHAEGPRSQGPFVEINCASIPATLLEAELFGHERGAFTDARERRTGLIEAADGGTLFLDEIGEVDAALQAKLLKLLEDKRVRRLGSVQERRVDVRVVAATNRDLERLVAEGVFRADLFFRLRILQVEMPPLRARGDDALELAEHFLALHRARYGKPGLVFDEGARHGIVMHAWPGNVRELRNVVEQGVIMARGPAIRREDLRLSSLSAEGAPAAPSGPQPAYGAPAGAFPAFDPVDEIPRTLPEMERQALVSALDRAGGNVSKAARLLGISRDTLRYRIDKLSLKRGR